MTDIERHSYLIGDYEREYALRKLKSAVQSRHLPLIEFDRRAELAGHARNQGDIDTLLRDIPDDLMIHTHRTSGLQKRFGNLAFNVLPHPDRWTHGKQFRRFCGAHGDSLFVPPFILKIDPESLYQPKISYKQIGN
ncbi:DUF1707 SHOCT-like domain-containing protein [Corynebacterium epidermidicanis]|uniref:Putative DUF1707 family protein n=1 Tax=Corynebacterium epidermidicanis TaxID=1050174 RepID=A0A0G3GSC8_9CORY|nr:DUF1707 domain-containing protein [Corynebacterium epidermidicanis]AKK02458.1 putative DUF1707 family protein [Corynebacterium epidermidicanis]